MYVILKNDTLNNFCKGSKDWEDYLRYGTVARYSRAAVVNACYTHMQGYFADQVYFFIPVFFIKYSVYSSFSSTKTTLLIAKLRFGNGDLNNVLISSTY